MKADDVLRSPQVDERVGELSRHVRVRVPERRDEQHPCVRGRTPQVTQEEQARWVGPVAVLDHEEDRRRGG